VLLMAYSLPSHTVTFLKSAVPAVTIALQQGVGMKVKNKP
jgi:hypothetical protein